MMEIAHEVQQELQRNNLLFWGDGFGEANSDLDSSIFSNMQSCVGPSEAGLPADRVGWPKQA